MKKTIYALHLLLLLLFLQSCRKDTFTQTGIADDHFFLRNEGQSMPVFVAGNVGSKKMLVILHGGPGGDVMAYRSTKIQEIVEPQVAVVYWSQRFAGRTQGAGGEQDISYFKDDLRKLLQLLRSKYGSDQQFYLLGHSWGGFLLPYFLLEPDNASLVAGFVQVDGVHNYALNDSLVYENLMAYGQQEIAAFRNSDFWTEVLYSAAISGFKGNSAAARLNSYAHKAEAKIDSIHNENIEVVLTANSPTSLLLLNSMVSGGFRHLYLPAYEESISGRLHEINKPALLLWGRYDFVCPLGLLADFESNLGSTDVSTHIFEHSGHSPMVNEPDLFWQTVINWLDTH